MRIGADGNDPDVTLTREEQFRVPRRKTPPPPMRVPTPEVAHDEADYVSIASTDTGDFELGSDLGGDVDTDSGETPLPSPGKSRRCAFRGLYLFTVATEPLFCLARPSPHVVPVAVSVPSWWWHVSVGC